MEQKRSNVITEIRRGMGIEGLVRASQVEEVRQIITESGIVKETDNCYKKILDEKSIFILGLAPITQILTPEQINLVLQTTSKYEEHQKYENSIGMFISELIQNSYNQGYNNFTLNTTRLKEISHIGHHITGTPENPIEITIIGNTGKNCGWLSENSTYTIEGNAGSDSASRLKNTTYTISGNIGYLFGSQSENSTFKTANQKTLKKMIELIPYHNRIIFIHPDGTEETKRDFS